MLFVGTIVGNIGDMLAKRQKCWYMPGYFTENLKFLRDFTLELSSVAFLHQGNPNKNLQNFFFLVPR